jgi:hypothetical protein
MNISGKWQASFKLVIQKIALSLEIAYTMRQQAKLVSK